MRACDPGSFTQPNVSYKTSGEITEPYLCNRSGRFSSEVYAQQNYFRPAASLRLHPAHGFLTTAKLLFPSSSHTCA